MYTASIFSQFQMILVDLILGLTGIEGKCYSQLFHEVQAFQVHPKQQRQIHYIIDTQLWAVA